jgi:hypothetical protein
MIRLRTALIVMLAACLLLVQGGVVAVYSSGVTTFFSSTTSVNTSNQTPGNQPSVSPPGSTGTSTTTMIAGSQNIGSFSATTTSITPSPSSNSSTSSPSQVQQQPNTTDTLFQTLEQSETSKLIRTPNFNPLTDEEPLLPSAASYKVTVCVSYHDIVASGCRNKRTSSQASEILAAMIFNEYLKGTEIRPFRVILPSAAPLTEQTQLLRKIETEAIDLIEAEILDDLKKSKIFLSESEEGRQKMLNIITRDAKRALQEADSGANWSHNINNDRSSHVFQATKAFKQFINNISVAQMKSQ